MFVFVSKHVSPMCAEAHYTLVDGKMELNDQYAALGLDPCATTEEIKVAFCEHSDQASHKCPLQYRALQIAYEILVDKEWRIHSDTLYRNHKGLPPPRSPMHGASTERGSEPVVNDGIVWEMGHLRIGNPGMVQARVDMINIRSAQSLKKEASSEHLVKSVLRTRSPRTGLCSCRSRALSRCCPRTRSPRTHFFACRTGALAYARHGCRGDGGLEVECTPADYSDELGDATLKVESMPTSSSDELDDDTLGAESTATTHSDELEDDTLEAESTLTSSSDELEDDTLLTDATPTPSSDDFEDDTLVEPNASVRPRCI